MALKRQITGKGVLKMSMTNHTPNYQDIEAAAAYLRQNDYKTYQLYQTVSESTGIEEYEEFTEEAAEMIKQIQAKQGALYTDEGKRALIREELEKLAQKKLDKAAKKTEKQAAALEELKKRLADDIARGSRITDTAAMEQLQAQTRTELSLATSARNVETVLRELVDRAERDKTVAQFVATYGYMFAERIAAVADQYERAVSMVQVQVMIDRAKQRAYSQALQAKVAIQNEVQMKDFFMSPSTRLIHMALDGLLQKF
jgi:vacuolar-type H+-ATPase subunit I/STV1